MKKYYYISDDEGVILDGDHSVMVNPNHERWDEFISSDPSPFDSVGAAYVPDAISPFQARAALHAAGLLDEVEAAIESSPPEVKIAWEYATEWRRDSPTIAALADALELSSDDVDNLFVAASEIVA